MLVCFLACVKSGHAYVPVDVSVPTSRVQDIMDSVEPEIVFNTADVDFSIPLASDLVDLEQIITISQKSDYEMDESFWLKPEDIFYIIFTSGSTGKPKGVQITTECLTNFVRWGQNLGGMNKKVSSVENLQNPVNTGKIRSGGVSGGMKLRRMRIMDSTLDIAS